MQSISIITRGIVKSNGTIEGSSSLLSVWASGDDPPGDGFMRYEIFDDRVHMIQIYIKTTERRKGYAKRLMKYIERFKKPIEVKTTAIEKDIFGMFLLSMGYYIKNNDTWTKDIKATRKVLE